MSTRSTSEDVTAAPVLPDGGLGERARWMLDALARIHAGGAEALDLAEIDAQFGGRPAGVDDAFVRKIWTTAARRLGGGRLVDVVVPQEHQLDLLIEVTPDRRFWLLTAVAPEPPHVLTRWGTAPAMPAGIELRRAEPEDGPGLAALERDARVVVGDVATRFVYEGDYFEWWELLDDPGAVIAGDDKDGIVAAVQTSTVPEAGRRMKTIVATPAGEDVQRRAIAADWGVEGGHEDDLEALLRAVCAHLAGRGTTHLAVFASPPTPGWAVLERLACGRDEFDLWTPPVAPSSSADRGTYVDAIAF